MIEHRKAPEPGDLYSHFKGRLVEVVCVATHTETNERMVVYMDMAGDFYARPYDMFMSRIDNDEEQDYRFEEVAK